MSDILRLTTNPRRGRCVIFNEMVFLGGQVADDRSQDIRGQTAQALAKVDRFLAEAGTDKSRILSAQIWLQDIARDFAGMNEVWDTWIDFNHAPARATAQCGLGAPGGLIEIIIVAAAR